jgi:hypothetical protein
MRRLKVEFTKDEFVKLHGSVPMHHIKTFEVIQFLRLDEEEFAAICRIEPESDEFTPSNFSSEELGGDFSGAQILEKEKNGGYIVFIKHKPAPPFDNSDALLNGTGGYLVSTEIREDKITMTHLGTSRQIKNILDRFRKNGIRYKILSLTDAKFSVNSPLNGLTEKQRKVLITAYKLGYYSLPRKVSTEQLAKKLNLHKSALQVHRRKAELGLITEVLKEQA